jgi:hypothetical protein
MNRILEKYWVYVGVLLGFLPLLGWGQSPEVGLTVLAILFSGLLTAATILPATKDYRKMKELELTGHINDLIRYIFLPLACAFFLLAISLIESIVGLGITLPSFVVFGKTCVVLALWGVFLCSSARLIWIVPHLLTDYCNSK